MSLQAALLILVSLAAAGLILTRRYSFAKADLERLRQQEYWTDRFRSGCRLLLEDSRVPTRLLEDLLRFNGSVLEPEACLSIYRVYDERVSAGAPASVVRSEEDRFLDEDDKLAQLVGDTFISGLMAITYSNLKWGEKTRGLMAHHYGDRREATSRASRAVKEAVQKPQHLPADLIAA